jgi:type VI secretion system protein VasJ
MDLVSLGKEPIGADQPAGSDVRYDEIFVDLQLEIDKLAIPSATGSVDWKKVVGLSSEILAHKSKDLLVAGYLAVALIHTHKDEGFAIGLKMYQDMLEHFWDDLYPSKNRMRGRVGAIEWWLEKTETALKLHDRPPPPFEQLNQVRENFEKVERILEQKLDDPPSIRPILTYLKSAPSSAEGAVEAEAQDAPKTIKEKESPVVTEKDERLGETEYAGEIGSLEDVDKVLNTALERMRDVASYFRQKDLSNPFLYRLDRAIAWLSIEEIPSSKDGQTWLHPPAAHITDMLYALRKRGDSETLLRTAEENLFQFVFWLDLNRLVAEALSSQGDQYQEAHAVVCQETAFFNLRLPGLEDLTFSDGTPFADPETKQWLKEIALGNDSAGLRSISIPDAVSTGEEEGLIRREIEEARVLIREKKLHEAVERLQRNLRNSFSEKERLLWRLAISQLFMNTKHAKLVLPQIEQILVDISRYRLEEYDPQLAMECLKIVWIGLKKQSDRAAREKAAKTLQRIARLDMTEVIRLEED